MKMQDFFKEYLQSEEYKEAEAEQKLKLDIARVVLYSRTKAGLSQTALARKVGTRQANISRIENATANPTLDVLDRIFKELNITASFKEGCCFEETPAFNKIEQTVNANWGDDKPQLQSRVIRATSVVRIMPVQEFS